MALPSAAFTVLTNGYRLVDQYFIKFVSVEAQAGVAASMFILLVFYACFEVLAAGAGPLIARSTGANEPEQRRRILGRGILGCLLLTLVLMATGYFFAEPLAGTMGLTPEVARETEKYLRILAITCLPLVLTPLVDQAFVSMGDAKTPAILHGVSLGCNLLLTPLLVLHYDLGITGAGLASNIARGVATGLGMIQLIKLSGVRMSDLGFGPELRRIVRLGTPIALATAFYGGVYWLILKTSVSPLGPEVNAALGIGWSALEGVSWPLFHGLSLAAASMVGRYLGAKDLEAAQKIVRLALAPTLILGTLATTIFYFLGSFLTGFFASSDVVHQHATLYAQILAASQIFVALESLAEGVLGGAGDTKAVFWLSSPYNALRVPLSWYWAIHLDWGAAGIWWAICATTVVKALLKAWAVKRGRWLNLEP